MYTFESIDNFSRMISELEIPLAIFDQKGQLLFCSKSMIASIGSEPSSLADLANNITSSPVEQKNLTGRFNQIINGGSFSMIIENDHINESSKVFELRASVNATVNQTQTSVFLVDLSRETNLFSKIEFLERLASTGRMTAGVAHEFNNILTAMLGWTQIAIKAAGTNESAVSALQVIDNNTRRAKQIAADLLNISKPKTSIKSVFSVSTAIDDALRLLSWDLSTAQISVTLEKQDAAYCLGDSTRIVQVFINIIRNAVEATPSNGTLSICVNKVDDQLHMSFADSGNGIPPNVIDKIFEPFFSTKFRGAETGGSGLGLAICKKIIEDHSGDISISSRRPGGTTVSVTLPAAAKETEASANVKTRSSFPPGISILVVDDEPDICEMIKTALTLRGAHVVAASNGNEAVNICKTKQFDAAFLDYSMAGLSGHDLGNAIAQIQPALPIVFMSGVQIPNDDNPNYTDFLKKPFDLHEIQIKLREVLNFD